MATSIPVIQIIGPTPPPHHGVSVATQVLLDSLPSGRFRVVHLDTADRRGIAHVDQPDLWDVLLFVRQWLHHVATLLVERPSISYLPLSQSRIGFLRDSFFMVPAFFMGTAVVVHLHGANFEQVYASSGGLFRCYVDWVFRRVRQFIVLGEMLRPIFERWAQVTDVAVVPNGVPEHGCAPIVRQARPADQRCRILFLSTLSKAKGLLVLLDALAVVARDDPQFECHIAGPWWGWESKRRLENG